MAKKQVEEDVEKRNFDFITNIAAGLDKEFGKGTAIMPNSDTILGQVEHSVSTRNFMIDWAIAGGLPQPRAAVPFGRITEISGLHSSGKTSLLGHLSAETQAMGGYAVIMDVEHALDLAYMAALGVDLSKFMVVQADSYEEGFSKLTSLIRLVKDSTTEKPFVTLGWDSIGATPTKSALEDDGTNAYGTAAKILGQNLLKFNGLIAKEKIAMVFTNHLYTTMGQYGSKYQAYGGEKLKYMTTLRLQLTQIGKIKEKVDGEEDQVIGHKVKVAVMKNKMAPNLLSVEVACLGGMGFSNDYMVFDKGSDLGVITGSAWKTWASPSGEELKFQGWNGFQEKIMVHPEYPELVKQVVSTFSSKNS
jgi:recombination protein RecA